MPECTGRVATDLADDTEVRRCWEEEPRLGPPSDVAFVLMLDEGDVDNWLPLSILSG